MFGLFEGVVKTVVGVVATPVAMVSDVIKSADPVQSQDANSTGKAIDLATDGVKQVFTPSKW